MDPFTIMGLAAASWAAKKFGRKPGGSKEPCHEGDIRHLRKYKWLAVPPSRRGDFALGGKVCSAADFMTYWQEYAAEHPEAKRMAYDIIAHLCVVAGGQTDGLRHHRAPVRGGRTLPGPHPPRRQRGLTRSTATISQHEGDSTMLPPQVYVGAGVMLAKGVKALFGGTGRGGGGSSRFERHCRMLSQTCSMSILRMDAASASFRCGGDGEGYFVVLAPESDGRVTMAVLSRTEWPGRVPPAVQEAVAGLDAKFRRSDWLIIRLRGGESNVLARTIARSLDRFDPETFAGAATDLVLNMKKLDAAIRRAGLE